MPQLDPTYTNQERERATRWKRTSLAVPLAARAPARYVDKNGDGHGPERGFCLPAGNAVYTLLPEVRETALALFRELRIPWHAGVNGGPSNHLLSSQVQCVNALGQMVHDPVRIVAAFADVLGTAEVLPIEPGRFLTFEYIGDRDYFNEAPHGHRRRGSLCTSVDAAFLHRTTTGSLELVLIEWKYTESYSLREPDPDKDETRRLRYQPALEAPPRRTWPLSSHSIGRLNWQSDRLSGRCGRSCCVVTTGSRCWTTRTSWIPPSRRANTSPATEARCRRCWAREQTRVHRPA